MRVFWSTREWAEAVAAMPADGPLAGRTVLVSRQRVAHALRRELLRLARPDVLCGTNFVTPGNAAEEVLHAAGVEFRRGEEALRQARLLSLFRAGLEGRGFRRKLLLDRPGWDEAIARTISELEAAGLSSDDLDGAGDERAADLARFWRRLDEVAGRSFTTARILAEAFRALERGAAWPFLGTTLAAVAGDVSAVEARFARAVPGVEIALLSARPIRQHHLARLAGLLGPEVSEALDRTPAPRSGDDALRVAASYLFEPPDVLVGDRPRAPKDDASVLLEEHAGTDAETEAAVRWVGEQVLCGVAPEDIAVLVPALDPLADLISSRLLRLPWPDAKGLPVHIAGGLPLDSTASGARTLAVLRALSEHLHVDTLRALLPALRLDSDERHLSIGAATELLGTLGAAGGDPSDPAGALLWTERAEARERDLLASLTDDDEDEGRRRRGIHDDLRAVRPALQALVAVAAHVLAEAPLPLLWAELYAFLEDWVRHPGEGPRAHDRLREGIAPLLADPSCAAIRGLEALRLIERVARSTRRAVGRFGEPAVYIGTVREAVGLPFRAVRVVGLAEGHLPSAAREEPVLPDGVRARLGAALRMGDRVLHDLHALDRVVRDTGECLVLSAPRTDAEGSQREVSSVLLEAAAALGRDAEKPVPDLDALRRDYFVPARARAAARARPLGEAAWHDAVAIGLCDPPRRWQADDLLRPGPDGEGAAGTSAGMVLATDVAVPGLDSSWPLSPSTLKTLLECPYRFLLERVLSLREPAAPRSRREIDALSYGSLLHEAAEAFYRAHGEDVAARRGELAAWRARAEAIADEAFERFLLRYPLSGEAVRRQERLRLRREVRSLVELDWSRGGWRLIGVERPFGFDRPVALPAGGRTLYLRGRIDRLEEEGGRTIVRDLKTGRRKTDPGPSHTIDAQIGAYGLVARAMASEWGLSGRIAASYTYVGKQRALERSFPRFEDALGAAAESWLALAADLLSRRAFPRTPREEDCRYCPFRVACGEDAGKRAEAVLLADPTLAEFADLKAREAKA
jgi:RecB family exonuclease